MLIGQYEIPQGAVIVGGFVGLVAMLLLYTWLKSSRTSDELQIFAQQMNWRWAGAAPTDLTSALSKLQDSSERWSTSKVMVVDGTYGQEFLFHYQKRQSHSTSSTTSSSISNDGMACLVPGQLVANTAVFSIERKPLKPLETYLELAGNLLAEAGSEGFRERFVVQSVGEAYYGNELGAAVAPIEISPALEAGMLHWHRALGQPQVWSKVYIRSGLVMVTKNWRQTMPLSEWQALLEMCQDLSRALRQ